VSLKSEAAIAGAGYRGIQSPLPQLAGILVTPLVAGRCRHQLFSGPDQPSAYEWQQRNLPPGGGFLCSGRAEFVERFGQ
jgi:hypothetical protein